MGEPYVYVHNTHPLIHNTPPILNTPHTQHPLNTQHTPPKHSPQEAPLLWCRLVEAHGVQPNTVTFNALMHAVAGSGDWHKALQLFQLMQQDPRFRPDVVSYGCVIRACERAGQWAMALEIFDEMVEGGLKPNARVFRSVIGACEKGEQWARAIDLFKLMQVCVWGVVWVCVAFCVGGVGMWGGGVVVV